MKDRRLGRQRRTFVVSPRSCSYLYLYIVVHLITCIYFHYSLETATTITTHASFSPRDENSKRQKKTTGVGGGKGHSYSIRNEDHQQLTLQGSESKEAPWKFPPPPSKWLEDVSSSVFCGTWKCAFNSKMSQARNINDLDQIQYGYLLSQGPSFLELRLGIERALELSKMYGIKHFQLGQPRKFNVTAEKIAEMGLNNNAKLIKGEHLDYWTEGKETQIFVQPIQLASERSILFGCSEKLHQHAKGKLIGLTHNREHFASFELKTFEAQVRLDVNATWGMLSSDEGACLWHDFQVFVNIDTGSIHHLDFDRCRRKGRRPRKKVKNCMHFLEDFLSSAYKQNGGKNALFDRFVPESSTTKRPEDSGKNEKSEKEKEELSKNKGTTWTSSQVERPMEAPRHFPPPSSEWLDDVASSVFCGTWKCAFHSKISQEHNSNHSNQIKLGYLLSQGPSFLELKLGAVRARELAERYAIKHFQLGHPRKFNITAKQIAEMGLNNNTKLVKGTSLDYQTAEKEPQIFVQPIQLAPKRSIVFGCNKRIEHHAKRKLIELTRNQQHLAAFEIKAFETQVKFDMNATRKMLSSDEGACLRYDFQVFFNPDTGSIHQLDFDRCMKTGTQSKEKDENCINIFQDFLNSAYKARGGIDALFDTTTLAKKTENAGQREAAENKKKETDQKKEKTWLSQHVGQQGEGLWAFPPPPSDWLEDVSSSVFCGAVKCAFHSKMSQARSISGLDQIQYGYLLSQGESFQKLELGAERAWELAEKYAIKHFLLGLPQTFSVTAKQITEMGLNNNVKLVEGERLEYQIEEKDPQIFVQPIQLAPESTILFGCGPKKGQHATKKLMELTYHQKNLTVLELNSFETNVQFDMNATRRMLSSAEGACLWYDFHVFFNPDTGNIHHLHLDRCRRKSLKDWKKIAKMEYNINCMKRLEQFLNSSYKLRGGVNVLW